MVSEEHFAELETRRYSDRNRTQVALRDPMCTAGLSNGCQAALRRLVVAVPKMG
jgi:hypothetical protein